MRRKAVSGSSRDQYNHARQILAWKASSGKLFSFSMATSNCGIRWERLFLVVAADTVIFLDRVDAT